MNSRRHYTIRKPFLLIRMESIASEVTQERTRSKRPLTDISTSFLEKIWIDWSKIDWQYNLQAQVAEKNLSEIQNGAFPANQVEIVATGIRVRSNDSWG